MATIITYTCDKCGAVYTSFLRLRHETMLRKDGPSSYYCANCRKKVYIYSDEEKLCPDCGCDQLIGHNYLKCIKCKEGKLIKDEDCERPVF